MEKRPEKEHELTDDELRSIQRKEVIAHDDSYDVDIEEEKAAIPVKEEKIIPTPPAEPPRETFFDDIDKKYALEDAPEEDDDDIEEELILQSPPVFEDSSFAEDVYGKKKDIKDREYLNRHSTINSDPEDIPLKPSKTIKKPEKQKALPSKKSNKDYTGLMTGLAIIVFGALILFLFLILWRATANNVTLSEAEKARVIEMSTFLAENEEYVNGMNQLSEQKRTLLESFFKDVRNRKELALDLLAIKEKERQIIELFNSEDWVDLGVNTAKDITYEFMSSNAKLTTSLIDMLGNRTEKGQMLTLYNDSVSQHTAQLYTLNEYVKTKVSSLGVRTIIEDKVIQIDLTNVR